uniref:Uncharacterized protein n=1 Tax=Ditylenchus dipsaci TaxID=166011 RepID=A0A915DB90_9BILA
MCCTFSWPFYWISTWPTSFHKNMRPKCILLVAIVFVSALSVGSAIVLDVFVLLLLNFSIGILTAIALGSINALVLDWCHHSNQPFAQNHLIGCRFWLLRSYHCVS